MLRAWAQGGLIPRLARQCSTAGSIVLSGDGKSRRVSSDRRKNGLGWSHTVESLLKDPAYTPLTRSDLFKATNEYAKEHGMAAIPNGGKLRLVLKHMIHRRVVRCIPSRERRTAAKGKPKFVYIHYDNCKIAPVKRARRAAMCANIPLSLE